MTCREIRLPDGGIVIACNRGERTSKALCAVCSKHRHTKLCDFPLTGAKAGKTCDRKLCDSCAVRQGHAEGDTIDYCPAHAARAAVAAKASTP